MTTPILLLDVMDTLVYDPFRREVPAFFGLDIEALLAAKTAEAWPAFERGEWDEARLAQGYFKDGRPCDVDGFKRALAGAYRWLEGVEPLLAELAAAGVPMHALSNYPCWYELIEERLGLSRYLRWSFVSCRPGVRKPDPRAYLGAADALGVAPADCLFVDDREANVRASQAVGMPAVRFSGADDLRARLTERGLLG